MLASLKSGGLGFLKGLKIAGAIGGAALCGALCLASLGIIPAIGWRLAGTRILALEALGVALAAPLMGGLLLVGYAAEEIKKK